MELCEAASNIAEQLINNVQNETYTQYFNLYKYIFLCMVLGILIFQTVHRKNLVYPV